MKINLDMPAHHKISVGAMVYLALASVAVALMLALAGHSVLALVMAAVAATLAGLAWHWLRCACKVPAPSQESPKESWRKG